MSIIFPLLTLYFQGGLFGTCEYMDENSALIQTTYKNRDSSSAQAWYNIKIHGGVSGNRRYLSTTSNGGNVDLWSSDDGSGRQRYTISKGSGDYYYIQVYAGVSGNKRYLSTRSDGSSVDLWHTDDASGRQRWTITKGSGDWFNINIYGGVSGNKRYLSTNSNGGNVDLWHTDDASGRQRWTISNGNGGLFNQAQPTPPPAPPPPAPAPPPPAFSGPLHQTEKGAESCPGAALTSTECKAAAVHYSKPWDRVDKWSNGPAGCFTNGQKVYFNTNQNGAASNPKWSLICHPPAPRPPPPAPAPPPPAPVPAPPQEECDKKRCYNSKNNKMKRDRCSENKCAACTECGQEEEPKPSKDRCSASCFSKRTGDLKPKVCSKNKCSGCSGC